MIRVSILNKVSTTEHISYSGCFCCYNKHFSQSILQSSLDIQSIQKERALFSGMVLYAEKYKGKYIDWYRSVTAVYTDVNPFSKTCVTQVVPFWGHCGGILFNYFPTQQEIHAFTHQINACNFISFFFFGPNLCRLLII